MNRTSLYELLSAVLVLPIIFGVLSPWVTYVDSDGVEKILTGLHPEYRILASIALIFGVIGALFISAPKEGAPLRRLWVKASIQAVATILILILVIQIQFLRPDEYTVNSGSFTHFFGQLFLFVLSAVEVKTTKMKSY